MSRFKEAVKPENLIFDYNLYDAVRFSDGRTAVITGYGIYDNQYWCEVCYPDGVHLAAADYFSSNTEFSGPNIIGKLTDDERKSILNDYVVALNQYPELYGTHIEFVKRELLSG